MENSCNDSNNSSRVDFIDLAKGLCILLVVFVHCCSHFEITTPIDVVCGAFRMPLYFFLSGLFFKTYENFYGFLKRKINKLLIPFLFFYLICSVCLPNILYELGYNVRNMENIGWLNSLYAVFSPSQRSFSNGPIWFLICLFNINLIFYFLVTFVSRMKNNVGILFFLCMIIGIVGGSLTKYNIRFPLYWDTALTCLPFFLFGYLMRNHTKILVHNKTDRFLLLYAFICVVYTIKYADIVGFQSNEFGNLWSLYTCGIAGTLFVVFISKRIHSLPVVSYCGRYSIIILCTHQMVIQTCLLLIKILKLDLNDYYIVFLTFIATIGIELIIIPFSRKFLPYVTAQKDVIIIH